jgi:hypothetical protein
MYRIKGAQIVLIGIIIYIYSLITKNKKANYISIVVMMGGYLYTFHAYFRLKNILDNMGEYATNDVSIGSGLITYIMSFVLLLIDVFIKDESPKKIDKKPKKELNKDIPSIDDKYILANYVFGIKKRPDLYNKQSILAIKDENSPLEIFIDGYKLTSIKIPSKDIVSLNFKPVLSEEGTDMDITSNENMTIFNELLDAWNLKIEDYTESFNEKNKLINKLDAKQTFDIEIIYKKRNSKQKLMFRTKEDPKEFLNKLCKTKID